MIILTFLNKLYTIWLDIRNSFNCVTFKIYIYFTEINILHNLQTDKSEVVITVLHLVISTRKLAIH